MTGQNTKQACTCKIRNRRHLACQILAVLEYRPVHNGILGLQVLITDGDGRRCTCVATGRVAVSLDGTQLAATLAVADGVAAGLARGVFSPLPQRVPPLQGAQPVAHHCAKQENDQAAPLSPGGRSCEKFSMCF